MSVNSVKISGIPITVAFNQSLNLTDIEYTICKKFDNLVALQFYATATPAASIPAGTVLATIENNGRPLATVNPTGSIRHEVHTEGIYKPCAFRIGTNGDISCRDNLQASTSQTWNIMFAISYVAN